VLENSICAVIVTFRPPSVVPGNLAKARSQVQGLVVVDNGSSPEDMAPVLAASRELDFKLIEKPANLGLAAALNIGVQWAKSQQYKFVALFDQDSTVTDGFIAAMVREYEANPLREKIAIVTSRHLEPETGEWEGPYPAEDGTPLVAITSGSLMPVDIFDRCGYFEEGLIIDSVDTEYCLRVRSMGYTIALCNQAFLHHSIGAPQMHSFLGLFMAKATHHSPKRHYYVNRNRLFIIRKYGRQYPGFRYLTARSLVRDIIVTLVVEGDRWNKLVNTLLGLFDGLRGRMGMVVKL
jgi:rhamnosyltransferase